MIKLQFYQINLHKQEFNLEHVYFAWDSLRSNDIQTFNSIVYSYINECNNLVNMIYNNLNLIYGKLILQWCFLLQTNIRKLKNIGILMLE